MSEAYVAMICFGEKSKIKELQDFIGPCIEDIINGEENDYLPPNDEDVDGEITQHIETGKSIDILTIDFPCLFMGRYGFEGGFDNLIEKFENVTFICAGRFENSEKHNIHIVEYFAAKNGKKIAEANSSFDAEDFGDEEEDDLLDRYDMAREEAMKFFSEGLADFIQGHDIDEMIFKEKNLCKQLVKLSQKFLSDSPYFIGNCLLDFPKDFWLDTECTNLIPHGFSFEDFAEEMKESKLLEDEAVCIALAKLDRKVLECLADEMREKVKSALD